MQRRELEPGTIFRYNWTTQISYVPPVTNPPKGSWPSTNPGSCEDDEVTIVTLPEYNVSAPSHYLTDGVEAIDAIEAWGLNFRLANVVKYIARCGKKPGVEAVDDLRKARAYLSREIAALEGRKAWE